MYFSIFFKFVDYTILFSIASCSSTWQLFSQAQKEKLVYLAITGMKYFQYIPPLYDYLSWEIPVTATPNLIKKSLKYEIIQK